MKRGSSWILVRCITAIALCSGLGNCTKALRQQSPVRATSKQVRTAADGGVDAGGSVWMERYRQARAYEATGSWSEAVRVWDGFQTGPEFLRSHVRARVRNGAFRAGMCERYLELEPTDLGEILSCLASTHQSSPLDTRLRAFVRGGSAVGISPMFWQTALTHSQDDPELRALLLRRMAIDYPEQSFVRREWPLARIESELRGLGANALTPAERRRRGTSLERARQYLLAEETLRPLTARGADERVRLLRQRADLLFRGRNYSEAETVFREAAHVTGRCPSCNAPADEFMALRAHIRATHGENGTPLLEAYLRRFARTRSAHDHNCEALALVASLAHEQLASEPNASGASRLLNRVVSARSEAQALACGGGAVYAFREGFSRYLLATHASPHAMRELTRARTAFSAANDAELAPLERARMQFWLGHVALAQHETQVAQAAFARVHAVDPLGYYSLLAARDTDRIPGLTRTQPLLDASGAVNVVSEQVLGALGYFLVRAGYPLEAGPLVEARRNEIVRRFGDTVLSEALHLVGKPEQSFRLHSSAWPAAAQANAQTTNGEQRLRLFFPTPHRTVVEARAATAQVSPWLVYAVMRQESGYNPRVISHAGAVGLLQIMPRVGTRIAGREVDDAALQDPNTNLELGIHHLGELVRRFGIPYCFAAYNAGGERVDAWKQRFARLSLIEQIEMIPYDETRNYVRRVVSHWARYQYLYQTAPAIPDILPRD